VTDVNKHIDLELGVRTENLPKIIMYPAYNKKTIVYSYSGEADSIAMSKWMHQKADIKFELKEKFFTPPKDENEGSVMMEMDEKGNIKPDSGKIAELQAKQQKEEEEKQAYIRRVEEAMRARGDLWIN